LAVRIIYLHCERRSGSAGVANCPGLEPETKRPVGEAFGYEHFHDASQKDLDGFWSGDGDLKIARDKIIVSLVQWPVGIWMTQIE
jgi:hypothetical protein